MRRDAIEILVDNQTRALQEHGVAHAEAVKEAEVRVNHLLEELNRIGLADVYVGVAMRRAQVYRLRSSGVCLNEICLRLGIQHRQVHRDYLRELDRRRTNLPE